jgi:hypothetical protein
MTPNVQAIRAEIYELARLLHMQGDSEGAKQVTEALTFTEDAGALTAIRRLRRITKETEK